MQLKSLRLLDASCNEITKLKGLSENKVWSIDSDYVSAFWVCNTYFQELRELKLYGNSIDPLDGLEK